ncbi:hypothetical protein BOTBODRAFT_48423 [Botryobasidium botryosum FD-172 SS1]|uniref:Uncharacterized protein n=1 Tax=Botryobasidium botryosum (strain FD-172 SS1) TaxID=930990 RepID=A0A067M829_BOTB1|nr:hypothetical protein BOTBODRAFT_48423 [Botryobasidium botryosum FD-172 SS1]
MANPKIIKMGCKNSTGARRSCDPAHRLPFEIFLHILELLKGGLEVDHFKPAATYSSAREEYLTTLARLLLVSKSWRHVVLRTPRLWSEIDTMEPEFVESFLSRSGSALLDVPFAYDYDSSTDFSEFISPLMPHVACWRSMEILEVPGADVAACIGCDMPQLESLRLTLNKWEAEHPRLNVIGRAPRLRRLELEGTVVPLLSPLFFGLSSLRLSFVRDRDTSTAYLCPMLRVLYLHDVHISSETLLSVVESRAGSPIGGAPLESLRMMYCTGIDQETVSKLERLVEDTVVVTEHSAEDRF